MLRHRELTERIIGLAIEVHRHSGPGLLESFYAVALWRELERAGIQARREVSIPAIYKGETLPLGFRADILVEETVILEIKAVPALLPVHDMQLQTYLRMSGLPVGLLFNFHALRLKDGPRRFVGWRRFLLRGPPWSSGCLRVLKIPGLIPARKTNGRMPSRGTTTSTPSVWYQTMAAETETTVTGHASAPPVSG